MLSSRDENERQKKQFEQQRQLESQRSVDRASERAANIGSEVDSYRKKKEVDVEFADKEAVNAAKLELARFFSQKGIDPATLKQGDEVFETTRSRYLAEQKAGTQKAKTGQVQDAFQEEATTATRIPNIKRLTSQANEGATRANIGEQFAQNNPKAIEAGLLGQELLPALSVARGNTMSVGPGEYMRRFTSGSPIIDSYFPPVEGQGMTQDERTVMQTIGGMQFPTQQKMTTPGSIKPIFSGKIPTGAAPQQQAAPAAPKAAMQQQAPQQHPAGPQAFSDADPLQNIPPEIAKQLEDPRYSPEAKQRILQGYFNSLIEAARPSAITRLLSPNTEAVWQDKEYLRRKNLLSPNY